MRPAVASPRRVRSNKKKKKKKKMQSAFAATSPCSHSSARRRRPSWRAPAARFHAASSQSVPRTIFARILHHTRALVGISLSSSWSAAVVSLGSFEKRETPRPLFSGRTGGDDSGALRLFFFSLFFLLLFVFLFFLKQRTFRESPPSQQTRGSSSRHLFSGRDGALLLQGAPRPAARFGRVHHRC